MSEAFEKWWRRVGFLEHDEDSPKESARIVWLAALAHAEGIARDAESSTLQTVWETLDRMIVRGPLPGNGCDASAQRNGIILASNEVFYLMHPDRRLKYAEDLQNAPSAGPQG